MRTAPIILAFWVPTLLTGASLGQEKTEPKTDQLAPPDRYYKIDQKLCDKIQDDMKESRVREIIGGLPHAEAKAVFAAPFSGKAMPVTRKQWWGEKNLIEVHFEDVTDTVCYQRVLEGTHRRFAGPGPEEPFKIAGVWKGHWQNSGGEDGEDVYVIEERLNGKLIGQVMWDGPWFSIAGDRLGRDTFRFEGKTAKRQYRYVGGLEDGELVFHYSAVNLESGQRYFGITKLRRVENEPSPRGSKSKK